MIVDVEKLYGVPMDIEWAYSNEQLYMLQEGQKFTDAGRFDAPEDIFWLPLDEIDRANA